MENITKVDSETLNKNSIVVITKTSLLKELEFLNKNLLSINERINYLNQLLKEF